MPDVPKVDPRAWLTARGWTEFTPSRLGKPYWRRTPNEAGWEGGWNLSGAVHQQLEMENRAVLMTMGLYQPPTRSRRRG